MLHMVDVGYSQLAVEVRGSQEPAVVFISGVQDDRHVWEAVVDLLPPTTLTLAYDRPGLGDSSVPSIASNHDSEGAAGAVRDLHIITNNLDVPAPFILVGHSLGALLGFVYAATYPDRCAGLILVDTSDPALLPPLAGFTDTVSDAETGTHFSWRSISQDFASTPTPMTPAVVIASAPGRWHRVRDPESYQPLDMTTVDAHWQHWQRTLAARLHASFVVATEAGHRVHTEAPELVAQTITLVLEAVRSSQRPRITSDRLSGVPGRVASPASAA